MLHSGGIFFQPLILNLQPFFTLHPSRRVGQIPQKEEMYGGTRPA
jgi:hypothetical protein